MRKLLLYFSLLVMAFTVHGRNKDMYLNVSGGYLHPRGMNVTLGIERELVLNSAVELYVDLYNQPGLCDRCGKMCKQKFWNTYNSVSIGAAYKWPVILLPKQSLRFTTGGDLGIDRERFLGSIELGLEYNYTLPNRMCITVRQKNDFVFRHGVKYFNGLLIGIKVPLKH